MKRFIRVIGLTTLLFIASSSIAQAIDLSVASVLSLPIVNTQTPSDALNTPSKSDEREAKRYESPETATVTEESSRSLPAVLLPVGSPVTSSEDPKVVQEKVIPLFSENILGVSTFFSRFHPGIDIRAKYGTPVIAMHAGRVIEAAYEPGGYGRYVVLEHEEDGSIVTTLYAHMKEFTVARGDVVQASDLVGYVGMTGRSTGPHLHLEVHQDTYAIDPLRYFTKGLPRKALAKK